MVKGSLILIGLLLIPLFTLISEVDIDASLSGSVTASKGWDDDVTSSSLASGTLSVKSTNSPNVKSQLSLDFSSLRSVDIVSISKAWVKFRYPIFRGTVGKTRITWGEGNAFNAGDVIFDDYSDDGEEIDLTADEIKSLNRTMALITFPLGRYTYTELIYLPYDFFDTDGDYSDLTIDQHSGGGRFVTRLSGIKWETGYIFNGYTEMHKPYISINGTLGVDYQASASLNIEHGETGFNAWSDTFKISPGIFYLFDLEDDRTLTLRLESLIYPYGDWGGDALSLYPEIAWDPNDEISLFLRAIIEPFNQDVEGTLGLNWKTYQGFTIGSYFTTTVTDNDDTEFSLSTVATHKF